MTYHPDNLKLQPYDHDKVIELANKAAELGIQFKINGIPFGASYDRKLWDDFERTEFGARCGVGTQPPQGLALPASKFGS